jgi:hypothetical protein
LDFLFYTAEGSKSTLEVPFEHSILFQPYLHFNLKFFEMLFYGFRFRFCRRITCTTLFCLACPCLLSCQSPVVADHAWSEILVSFGMMHLTSSRTLGSIDIFSKLVFKRRGVHHLKNKLI